jgi:hypothetical protein
MYSDILLPSTNFSEVEASVEKSYVQKKLDYEQLVQ